MKYSVLFLFLIPLSTSAQCVSDTNNIYGFTYNGTNYEIVKENLDWISASACAVERGGILAEINSQEEQDTVFYHVNNSGITASNTVAPDGGGASYLWIGGNDLANEGEWVWDGNNDGSGTQFWEGTSSGFPVGGLYNNWGNEPDDYNGQDGLGFAFTNWPLGVAGEWNDVDETNTLYYIIEYPNTSGLEELQKESVLVYPNPANEQVKVFIGNDVDPATLTIFSADGKQVASGNYENGVFTINTSGFENGIYHILINDEIKEKFIVQH